MDEEGGNPRSSAQTAFEGQAVRSFSWLAVSENAK